MKEIDARFTSNESIKAKAARAFGMDQPHVFDTLRRVDFANDDAYLDAAVTAEMQRSSPEYQAIRRRLARELDERREKDTRAAQNETYKAIRGTIKLDDIDVKNIDNEAADLARRDLAAGRIRASDLGAQIEKYAGELTEKRKDSRAAAKMFNDMIRGR